MLTAKEQLDLVAALGAEVGACRVRLANAETAHWHALRGRKAEPARAVRDARRKLADAVTVLERQQAHTLAMWGRP